MAEFVKFTLDDGSEVFFESAESDLVQMRDGSADVADGGRLRGRLEAVAAAAEQVAESLRGRLAPDEVALEFGLKVSAEASWWFFAKTGAEGTIKVTLTWKPPQSNGTAAEKPRQPHSPAAGAG
jgi:hypothetical protein